MYVKNVLEEEDGIYGLGFAVMNQKNMNNWKIPMVLRLLLLDTKQWAIILMKGLILLQMYYLSELINFYSVVYETTDLQKYITVLLNNWHWDTHRRKG